MNRNGLMGFQGWARRHDTLARCSIRDRDRIDQVRTTHHGLNSDILFDRP